MLWLQLFTQALIIKTLTVFGQGIRRLRILFSEGAQGFSFTSPTSVARFRVYHSLLYYSQKFHYAKYQMKGTNQLSNTVYFLNLGFVKPSV